MHKDDVLSTICVNWLKDAVPVSTFEKARVDLEDDYWVIISQPRKNKPDKLTHIPYMQIMSMIVE